MRLQAADYDDDTVMEYTPPEETNRRQRQREIEAEREREQKVAVVLSHCMVQKLWQIFVA